METVPISFAKITKPRLQKVLLRQRLFDLLEESRSYPATWITGPGGCGKTTLVTSYLDQYQLPCIWYQIDESDSDIANFFYYMSLAGRKIAPRERSLPLLTSEYSLGMSAFTRRFFESLFSRLKKPGLIVIDDYQQAPPGALLHGVLRDAIAVIPVNTNVFILSRQQPPPELSRARAGSVVNEIGWKELRLDPSESRELLSLVGQKTCADNFADQIHEKTDGWITGLILMVKRIEIEDSRIESLAQLSERPVFEYFASEIFETADPEIQEFLLETSIFPAMTTWMAKELTGLEKAEQLLSQMNRDHWFTYKRGTTEAEYQYHPMFRDFLLSKASQTYPAEFITRLKERAALILKQYGLMESAVSLMIEAGNRDSAVHMILANAEMMVLQGRTQTLEQWLVSLSPELFDREPWLLYWMGACRLPVKPAEGKDLFERALALFEHRQDTAGIFLSLSGVLASITYSGDSFKPFDQWITKLAALSGDFESLPSPEIKGRVAFSMLQALTLRQPWHPDFMTWEKRGLQILQSSVSADLKIQVILPMIIHRLFAGSMAEARYFINFYRELARSPNINPLALITLKDLEAFYYWLKGRFKECRNVVTEALDLASSTGIHLVSSYVLGHGAAGALSSGNTHEAAKFISSIEKHVVQASGWTRELFHTLTLWQALLERDLPGAILHGQIALEYSEKTGSPLSASFDHLGMALAFHASGNSPEAVENLSRAFTICRTTGSLQTEFACHLAEAEFALDSGDEASAAGSLERAFAIGKQQQYVNTWFWRPQVMVRLCSKSLEAGIETDYVQKLIRLRNLVADSPPVEILNWPWPLKIFTLGRFAVTKDDAPLSFEGKAQEKPLALLKVLISLGGREVSEARIADVLWPEADGDLAHGNFKTTLHRLRNLLGYRDAVQTASGRITLDHKCCWVDAWAFERILSKADAAFKDTCKDSDPEKAHGLIKKALDLYHGKFLQSDEHSFALREHLHHRFLAAVKELGAYMEKQERWEKAIDTYETGLKADPLAEFCYQRLMACHHRLGRRASVLSEYNRCKKALSMSLGIAPSPSTETLIKILLSEKKGNNNFSDL